LDSSFSAATPVPTVGFTSNNASIVEGNSGTKAFNFTVQLSAAATAPVTVNYSTEINTGGAAKANTDYLPVTSSVVFAPGETSKTVTVNVIGDTVYETNEYFYLSLKSVDGATIVTNGAEGYRNNWVMATIINDDALSVITKTDKGIFGTTSQDTIGGTSAADFIFGKGGADLITGFAGNDTFVFSKVDASKLINDSAQIADFKDDFDMIGLQGLMFGDLKVAQGTGSHVADTMVSMASGETLVVLVGVNASSINASDFVVV
jgi:Ca2+-binding RTX toxin-like protein